MVRIVLCTLLTLAFVSPAFGQDFIGRVKQLEDHNAVHAKAMSEIKEELAAIRKELAELKKSTCLCSDVAKFASVPDKAVSTVETPSTQLPHQQPIQKSVSTHLYYYSEPQPVYSQPQMSFGGFGGGMMGSSGGCANGSCGGGFFRRR